MDDISHQALRRIREAVCRHFQVSVRALEGPRRTQPLPNARAVAMALAYDLLHEVTASSIAITNGRQRGATKSSVRKVNGNPDLLRAFHLLKRELINEPEFRGL